MHIQCGDYWSPNAKVTSHQCWPNLHCIWPVSDRNVIFTADIYRKNWRHGKAVKRFRKCLRMVVWRCQSSCMGLSVSIRLECDKLHPWLLSWKTLSMIKGPQQTHPVITHVSHGQNGRHFTDDIFRSNFINEKLCILIKISLMVVPKGLIDSKSALVQVAAWRRTGDTPLPEEVLIQSLDAYMWH